MREAAGYGERMELDEREFIAANSKRILAVAFGAVGALALAFVVALIVVSQLGGGLSPRDAYGRCSQPHRVCPGMWT